MVSHFSFPCLIHQHLFYHQLNPQVYIISDIRNFQNDDFAVLPAAKCHEWNMHVLCVFLLYLVHLYLIPFKNSVLKHKEKFTVKTFWEHPKTTLEMGLHYFWYLCLFHASLTSYYNCLHEAFNRLPFLIRSIFYMEFDIKMWTKLAKLTNRVFYNSGHEAFILSWQFWWLIFIHYCFIMSLSNWIPFIYR